MDENRLFTGAIQILILLLAVSVHESAHAWMANRCGDSTARDLGRITLNPLKHLDLFGSLLLPLLLVVAGGPVFGWARPTPVLLRNLRRPKQDDMLVSIAGPAANLILAVLGVVALRGAVVLLGPEARQAAFLGLSQSIAAAAELPHFPVTFTLVQLVFINAFLAVFNLLPIPPLDGGQIALNLLPPDWAAKLATIRPYGLLIVVALAMFNVLTLLLLPIYLVLTMVITL